MATTYDYRNDFPPEFIADLAHVVIWFGRLERCVVMAIKNLLIANGMSKNYDEGLKLAIKHRDFSMKLAYMAELYLKRYGAGTGHDEVLKAVETMKRIAIHRNTLLHGAWTHDENKVPLLMHSRRDKKSDTLTDWVKQVGGTAMKTQIANTVAAFGALDTVRRTWAAP